MTIHSVGKPGSAVLFCTLSVLHYPAEHAEQPARSCELTSGQGAKVQFVDTGSLGNSQRGSSSPHVSDSNVLNTEYRIGLSSLGWWAPTVKQLDTHHSTRPHDTELDALK